MRDILQIIFILLMSIPMLTGCLFGPSKTQIDNKPVLQENAMIPGRKPGQVVTGKMAQVMSEEAAMQVEKPESRFNNETGSRFNDEMNQTNQVNNQPNRISDKLNQINRELFDDKEEKVIISINNLGRTNPFKPFHERSLIANVSNIPPPPMYSPPSPEIKKLLGVKVSGILYDPPGSSAIINIGENDYLVHKGDLVFDYYIKDITADKVVIKYGNNVYKAGIGEVIAEVNKDPVKGIDKMFGGSQKISSLPEIKIITPSYGP